MRPLSLHKFSFMKASVIAIYKSPMCRRQWWWLSHTTAVKQIPDDGVEKRVYVAYNCRNLVTWAASSACIASLHRFLRLADPVRSQRSLHAQSRSTSSCLFHACKAKPLLQIVLYEPKSLTSYSGSQLHSLSLLDPRHERTGHARHHKDDRHA